MRIIQEANSIEVTEMKKNDTVIEITEDVKLPGTNVILEKGDKIEVLSEAIYTDIVQAIIKRTGMAVPGLARSDSEHFINWLEDNFRLKQELDLRGKVTAYFSYDGKKQILTLTDDYGSGASIYIDEFVTKGTDWGAYRIFSTYEI